MIRAATSSAEETRAMACAIAALAQAGDVLVLVGDLGAGKTAFAQGFATGLGITAPVTSPTFTLHNQYPGRLTLNHLDVYRLEQLEEVADLGLPELLDAKAVALIEWGDTIVPALDPDYLEVRLTYGPADHDRVIALRCVGGRWSARSRTLGTALAAWTTDGDAPC